MSLGRPVHMRYIQMNEYQDIMAVIKWWTFSRQQFLIFVFLFEFQNYVLEGPTDTKSPLVQIMAWCWTVVILVFLSGISFHDSHFILFMELILWWWWWWWNDDTDAIIMIIWTSNLHTGNSYYILRRYLYRHYFGFRLTVTLILNKEAMWCQ